MNEPNGGDGATYRPSPPAQVPTVDEDAVLERASPLARAWLEANFPTEGVPGPVERNRIRAGFLSGYRAAVADERAAADALRAEIHRLVTQYAEERAQHEGDLATSCRTFTGYQEAMARAEAAEASLESLRAAVERIVKFEHPESSCLDVNGQALCRAAHHGALDIARAALAPAVMADGEAEVES